MPEDLTDYMREVGIRVKYLHSDIDTLERAEIIRDMRKMCIRDRGTYSGIGAMLSQNRTTGLCTIVKVFEGSPALEAGMQPGDIIYKVGDTLVASESLRCV